MIGAQIKDDVFILYVETNDHAVELDLDQPASASIIRFSGLFNGRPKSLDEKHHALAWGILRMWAEGHSPDKVGNMRETVGIPTGLRNWTIGGTSSGKDSVCAAKVWRRKFYSVKVAIRFGACQWVSC